MLKLFVHAVNVDFWVKIESYLFTKECLSKIGLGFT